MRAEDWFLFQQIVADYNVKSVLEFGCGLSTLLWQALDLETLSFETDIKFMKRVSDFCNDKTTLATWDNITTFDLSADYDFDLAFVDGIDPRDIQIRIAAKVAPVVIVHDGYSRPTPEFINYYLDDWQEIKVDSLRSRLFLKQEKISQV